MGKYNSLYFKRTASICAAIALPVALIVFIIAKIFNIFPHDTYLALVPIGVGLIVLLFSLLNILKFNSSVKRCKVPFNDKNARPLFTGAPVFLSESWLIVPGNFAATREHIRKISTGIRKSARGNDYYVTVVTDDNKLHTFPVDSSSSAKKVAAWGKKDEK